MRGLKLLGGVAASLAAMSMTLPAGAQAWGPRRHYGHHDDGGGIIAALLAGGILGAVIASASKKPQPVEVVTTDAPPPEAYDAPPPAAGEAPPPPRSEMRYDEESATDACAAAAEEEGSHYARIAQVDRVASVEHSGQAWQVNGTLRLTDSLRSSDRRTRDFRCTLHEGDAHPQVTIADGPGAA